MTFDNRYFPHLLPADIAVWKRWLDKYATNYTRIEYDIRVGDGRDPGPTFPDNIRNMAIGLSQRRIDAIAHESSGVTIIEITHTCGLTAIGQITSYPILYKLAYPDIHIIDRAIVTASLQADIMPVIRDNHITLYLMPD
jgi:hypothetical protein